MGGHRRIRPGIHLLLERVSPENAIYHVLAGGDRREDIVLDENDRNGFEGTLEEVVEKSGWVLLAWVLMSNH